MDMDTPILAKAVEPASSFASTLRDSMFTSMEAHHIEEQTQDDQTFGESAAKTPPLPHHCQRMASRPIDEAMPDMPQMPICPTKASQPESTIANVQSASKQPVLEATQVGELASAVNAACGLSESNIPSDDLCAQMEAEMRVAIQQALTQPQQATAEELTSEQLATKAKIDKYKQAILEGVKARTLRPSVSRATGPCEQRVIT